MAFEKELLCFTCGNGCIKEENIPRRNIYFCSQLADVPAPPFS
jgi:hypothetical protein